MQRIVVQAPRGSNLPFPFFLLEDTHVRRKTAVTISRFLFDDIEVVHSRAVISQKS